MKKALFIIFIISLIPYAIILGYGIYSAIFGYDVYTWILPTYVKTIYGLDAFLETVTILSLTLIFIPVIPVCFLYQIVFLATKLIKFLKNKFTSQKTEQNESGK